MKGFGGELVPIGLFPWQKVAGAVVVVVMLLAAGVLSRRQAVLAPGMAPGAGPAVPVAAGQPLRVANVGDVLRYGRLPKLFSYRGKRYEALAAGGYGAYLPLIRTGSLPDGHLVYYERGAMTQPFDTLYLRVTDEGPGSDVYVRYRLAPELKLP